MNNKNIQKMKKIAYFSLFCALFAFGSCSLFEVDNYELPKETLRGSVVDADGNPVLTEQNGNGIPVRLTELSWTGGTAEHNPDFYCKPDGTFQNTKIFEGTYKVELFGGPFIPLTRVDQDNNVLADGSQTVKIKGTKTVEFVVQPFLNVEFASEPMVTNGKISVQVRVTRAISPEDFRALIEPMGNYSESFLNVTDIQLLVSYSRSVESSGKEYRDERWSTPYPYNGASFEPLLGQKVTLESKDNIPSGRTVFIRAAARINYDTPRGTGTRRYNFSEVMEVFIP